MLLMLSPGELQYYISQLDHGNPPRHGGPPLKAIIAFRKPSKNGAGGGSLKVATPGVTKNAEGGSLTMPDYNSEARF